MARPIVGGIGVRAALLGLALIVVAALIISRFIALAVAVILAIIGDFVGVGMSCVIAHHLAGSLISA